MTPWLTIPLFGALGCLTRHLVSGWAYTLLGRGFPYGTLVVNVLGSFLLGLVMEGSLRSTLLSPEVRIGITTGTFEPIRIMRTCGMQRSRNSSSSSTPSVMVRGSPPEMSTSRTSVCCSI